MINRANQINESLVQHFVTPTPAPSLPPLSDGGPDWTDILSAVSDAVVAVGTLGTLILIVVTVRQQGKALSLQIEQLRHEQEIRETERRQADQEERQRKLAQARRVRIDSHEDDYDPSDQFADVYSTSAVIEPLKAERMRETGRRPWRAAFITVNNGSDMVLRNLSCHIQGLPRPQYVYREGATELMKVYELDHLGPGREADFVWMDQGVQDLHNAKAELHFSDEDGHRWSVDLRGQTTRVDRLP